MEIRSIEDIFKKITDHDPTNFVQVEFIEDADEEDQWAVDVYGPENDDGFTKLIAFGWDKNLDLALYKAYMNLIGDYINRQECNGN